MSVPFQKSANAKANNFSFSKLFTNSLPLIILNKIHYRLLTYGEQTMKKYWVILVLLTFGIVSLAEAQLREEVTRSNDFTGAVIQTDQPGFNALGNLMESINMEMGHSYSMNFGSVGGRFQNLNAYTNHMTFDLSDNLTGNVDVSILHSPFGNSYMNMSNDLGARVVIDRAQLDYQISPNTSLSIQFSQRPYGGMGGYYGAGAFGPRNNIWY